MLIDTHAHLTDERIDCKQVIADMKADGLDRIITVGYNMESSVGSYDIAQTDDRVFCALGIHPSNTNEVKDGDYDKLLELSKNKKVVAIGEIGLDYHYDDTDKVKQQKEFLAQMDLVKSANLPVAIHLRDAYQDMYNLIKANKDKFSKGGVMHCFSGSKETALQYIDMGFYISFSGTITFKNAKSYPDIIKAIPRDRILIETDCPYLAPTPFRGQLNYPKYVSYQAERIGDILLESPEKIKEITYQNAFRLFDKLT